MFLVHNERTKHVASWLNALATALVAAGVFAPAAALLYGLSQPVLSVTYVIGIVVVCFAGGVFLHWFGKLLLGRLRE
jgi:hypothetical protein